MHPGERIKEFRLKKGLTLKEFGKTIGYSFVHVSNIERSSLQPSRDFLIKLWEIYGLPETYILHGIALNENFPPVVTDQKMEYNVNPIRERRLPENTSKRRLIDKVIKILDSGNKKFIKALKSNIEAFLPPMESKKPEVKKGD